MFCTKHSDHNIVTAALETLNQILLCQAKFLTAILLSPTGIAPTITGQLPDLSGYSLSSVIKLGTKNMNDNNNLKSKNYFFDFIYNR